MGGTRAVIASLGASISLVAGAALSLLVVSFIFAYDGLVGTSDDPASRSALVVDEPSSPRSLERGDRGARPAALVIEEQPPAPRAPAAATVQRQRAPSVVSAEAGAPDLQRSSVPEVNVGQPVAPPPPPAAQPAEPAPAPGDGVRDLGEAVGATVDGTGDVAGALAARLGPPVSEAVQGVLDIVTTLLQRTTGSLAGTLDALKK